MKNKNTIACNMYARLLWISIFLFVCVLFSVSAFAYVENINNDMANNGDLGGNGNIQRSKDDDMLMGDSISPHSGMLDSASNGMNSNGLDDTDGISTTNDNLTDYNSDKASGENTSDRNSSDVENVSESSVGKTIALIIAVVVAILIIIIIIALMAKQDGRKR